MKDQNKTRFEVGMPVIAIIDGESFTTKIESINYEALGVHYPICIEHRINEELTSKCVFTDDGHSDIFCEVPMLYTLPEYEALKALTDSFVDGTFGKEQADLEQNTQPTPETTDLLDENGQPVYFEIGMEVGSLVYGKGKVTDVDVDNGNICVSIEGQGDYWHTLDGILFTGGNQTLYPIEQYNQIQLPKLKPIQVKPKEDVIELPSWFKGGAFLNKNAVLSFINSQGVEVENSFNEAFIKLGIAISDCTFFRASTVDSYFAIDFTSDNKLYNVFINMEKFNADIYIAYRKNGKNISETL